MRYAPGRWDEGRWDRNLGRFFTIGGRPGATGAAANEVVGQLWNPSGTRSLWVVEINYNQDTNPSVSAPPLKLCRSTTAGGTPNSTQTPDLDNDWRRETSPNTGAVAYFGNFTTEPTLVSPPLYRLGFPDGGVVQAVTWLFPGEGIRVRPGTGLALATVTAVATGPTVMAFRFRE